MTNVTNIKENRKTAEKKPQRPDDNQMALMRMADTISEITAIMGRAGRVSFNLQDNMMGIVWDKGPNMAVVLAFCNHHHPDMSLFADELPNSKLYQIAGFCEMHDISFDVF